MFVLNHLIKDPTCFKSSNIPCFENFYTNKKKTMVFNWSIVETSISDHHSLICTMLLSTFCRRPEKVIYYKSYNSHNKEQFENVLKQRLIASSNFEEFCDTFLATMNEHAPLRKKKIDLIIEYSAS